jgi:hypothetical protein
MKVYARLYRSEWEWYLEERGSALNEIKTVSLNSSSPLIWVLDQVQTDGWSVNAILSSHEVYLERKAPL